MPNEKLKWQQTDTWNIGLEMGLLNGRITARAEYFQKLTKNSLTQVTLAPSLVLVPIRKIWVPWKIKVLS